MCAAPRPLYPFQRTSGPSLAVRARTRTNAALRSSCRWVAGSRGSVVGDPPAARAPRPARRFSYRSPLPTAIGGPGARAVLATPAVVAAGRPLAVALLVVGLAALTALMLWVLDRSGPRASRDAERAA